MSKMGAEFEKNLDNAKYDLYKVLREVNCFLYYDQSPFEDGLKEKVEKALTKVQKLDI